jgi:hypothetical protein
MWLRKSSRLREGREISLCEARWEGGVYGWGLTLDPVYHALGLALQLVAEVVNVAVHHFLIDLEAPVGRVEI